MGTDIKQYLQQLKWLDSIIGQDLDELERLQSLAEKVTTVFVHAKAQGSRKDRTSEIVCKIVELQEKINNNIDSYVDIKIDMMLRLNAINDNKLRLLLTMRYVEDKCWEDIADQLGHSVRWVYVLHGKALEVL